METTEVNKLIDKMRLVVLQGNAQRQAKVNNLLTEISFNNTVVEFIEMQRPYIIAKVESLNQRIIAQEVYTDKLFDQLALEEIEESRYEELTRSANELKCVLIQERMQLINKLYL